MKNLLLLFIAAWLAFSCAADPETPTAPAAPKVIDRTVSLGPPPAGAYQVTTPTFEVQPITEVDICTVVHVKPKNGEKYIWVNQMESLVSKGTHHMNVFIGQFSFLDGYLGDGASAAALGVPPGQYPCSELSVMESAFPIFPSQRENQQIQLPKGVGVPMPLPLMLIFSHHYFNITKDVVKMNATLNVQGIPADEVEQVAGLVFDGAAISIPGESKKVSQDTCLFNRDVNVALVSTHNHEWTECATLHHYEGDGKSVEKDPFFVNHLWDQPPILHFKPGEFSLKAGQGVHFACHHRNYKKSELTNDGTAQGEMCVFAAVVYPLKWSVPEVAEVLESGQLDKLLTFMDDAMGGCDAKASGLSAPFSSTPQPLQGGTSTCKGLEQTESNVLVE